MFLIDKVILPPTSEDDVEKKVSELLFKYQLEKEIVKSKLDLPPLY